MSQERAPTTISAIAALAAAAALLFGSPASANDLAAELKGYDHGIVYESYRDGNWELMQVGLDGSRPVNLTRTRGVNELCPHVSPDGRRVTFLVDEGEGGALVRSGWCMNLDGTDRRLIGERIRWTCWDPAATRIAYTKQEEEAFSYADGTTLGLFFYDIAGGTHARHPNEAIRHVYNLCWSPDGRWITATVHAGMGYRHTNLAIEAEGERVVDLGIRGCRPDVSPDGTRIAWGETDWTLRVADLDLSCPEPKVSGMRTLVASEKPMMVYHVDWSPDGNYVAFTRGPRRKRLGRSPAYLGIPGDGWNICVADAARPNRWVAITHDGKSNKEPDWIP